MARHYDEDSLWDDPEKLITEDDEEDYAFTDDDFPDEDEYPEESTEDDYPIF